MRGASFRPDVRLEDIDADLSTDAPPSPFKFGRADSFSRAPMPENQPSPSERLERARQDRASRASRVDSVSFAAVSSTLPPEGAQSSGAATAMSPSATAMLPSDGDIDAPIATQQPVAATTNPAATTEAPTVAPSEDVQSSARGRRKRVPLVEAGPCCRICMDLTVWGSTCYTCVKFPDVDFHAPALRVLSSMPQLVR